ncbi:MAG TPA: PEGA domain-containing protein [Polyangiaceae bacterium]|nr:PEGA domain-containing protein [Polyangiaceae bacterium]
MTHASRSPALLAMLPLKARRHVLGASCAALIATLSQPSHADEAAENIAAARTLGIQGVQLADAGKCPEAIEKLTRAEALHHAPTILGRLGECQVNVGEVVAGTENLNMTVREVLPASAPKVFRDAQERAQKVLTAAMPKIAQLVIHVTPANVKASVSVAGKPVPPALLGAERPTNPGAHQVTVSAEGYKPVQVTVTLAEGEHQEVTLQLEKDPNAVGALPASTVAGAPPPVENPSPQPAAKKSKLPAFVAFGVGGAGLIVGGITGGLALSKAGDCPNKLCETQSDLDSAKTMATVSTIGFGVGIAGVAAGTILLLTSSSHSEKSARAQPARAPKFAMQPWFGLTSAGVSGSFQ